MNSQEIAEDTKCSMFCFTLGVDAHLWYESITPVGNDWNNLQRLFHVQFSKLGQTQGELFKKGRSFQFDETTDTIDFCFLRLK